MTRPDRSSDPLQPMMTIEEFDTFLNEVQVDLERAEEYVRRQNIRRERERRARRLRHPGARMTSADLRIFRNISGH